MDYANKSVKRAGEVVQSFVAVSKTITQFTQQNSASLGLTLPQMGILNTISSNPGITLKEITDKLTMSKSTVSVSIDDLVNSSLVERQESMKDRREINLKSTSKGLELSRKSSENAFAYRAMVSALEKMSEKDIDVLLQLHNEILLHLKEYKPIINNG
jgi:DNA-binding MarR family transcriptional regulator